MSVTQTKARSKPARQALILFYGFLVLSAFCFVSGALGQSAPTETTIPWCPAPHQPLYAFDVRWGGEDAARLNAPQGLFITAKGELFIADSGNDRIQVWDLEGKPLRNFGSFGQAAFWRDPPEFNRPTGVLVHPNGSIYVADTLNHRVVLVDASGKAVTAWGSQGMEPGLFDKPRALARDRYGNIWVLDMGNSRIQLFSPFGRFMQNWGGYGQEPGQFNFPEGLALSGIDESYVADTGNFRVQILQDNGVPVTTRGWYGEGPAQFKKPVGITVVCTGIIAVLDSDGRVQFFRRRWEYLGDWRPSKEQLSGIEPPLFRAIASDKDGRIYLADAWNNLIWRLKETNQHDSTHHHHLTPTQGEGTTFRGQGYPIRGIP